MGIVKAINDLRTSKIRFRKINSKSYRVIIRIYPKNRNDMNVIRHIQLYNLSNMKTFDGSGYGFGYYEWFFN